MKTKAIALFLLGFIPAFAQDIPTSKTEQNMDRKNTERTTSGLNARAGKPLRLTFCGIFDVSAPIIV